MALERKEETKAKAACNQKQRADKAGRVDQPVTAEYNDPGDSKTEESGKDTFKDLDTANLSPELMQLCLSSFRQSNFLYSHFGDSTNIGGQQPACRNS